jgi:hypothetical protein
MQLDAKGPEAGPCNGDQWGMQRPPHTVDPQNLMILIQI